ncbi:MAG: hypothetical protein NC299_01630 [Lachnospiraceae bacterium]|nr:hypothetical protein [Ruminococcus sp.]MCM1274049.1 hypothetical protein [Lachnospiraceae bacterium]
MENENNAERAPVITESPPSGDTATAVAEQNTAPPPEPPQAAVTEEARAYAEQTAAVERKQAELEEQDKKLLAALDEVLEKRTREMREQQKKSQSKAERVAAKVVKKGVGFVSLGLIMIFLGIVLICCLFSPKPDFMLPLRLSPICAILVGVELLLNQLMTRGHFRINIPSLVISALLVVGCCFMCVKLNGTYKEDKQEYNNRSIAAEIYDRSYKELRYVADIADITVEVELNPDGTGQAKGVEALSTDDHVNITVEFAGTYNSPKAFAADCKKILDGYRIMGINVTNFYFGNSGEFHSYSLDVEGRYAQDQSESKLAEAVSYVYLDDADYMEDLEDFTDEPEEGEEESRAEART